jgi:hypothetical protein
MLNFKINLKNLSKGKNQELNIIPNLTVYENEISIVYSKLDNEFCVDTETFDGELTEEMLEELLQIVKLLNEHKDEVLDMIKV